MSKIIGSDLARADCMKACLALLSSLATDKETATLVFATQKSILSGGAHNKYSETVGRLFKPCMKPLSPEVLTQICLVEDVIEMCEIPVLPESNKLLLLCMLDRQVTPLIYAKKEKERVTRILYETLRKVTSKQEFDAEFNKIISKFNMTQHLDLIKSYGSEQEFKNNNEELFNKFMATYLQNVTHIHFDQILSREYQISEILKAQNIDTVAKVLYLNIEYLTKMITRANMNSEQFLTMIPQFLNELVNRDDDSKMSIYQKFF